MAYRLVILFICSVSAARTAPILVSSVKSSVKTPAAAPSETSNRGNFSAECEPHPNQRIVLVTVNGDYVSFFRNWYHHAKPFLHSTEHLYVIAEDEQAAVDLEALQKDHQFTLIKRKDTETAGSLLQAAASAPYNSKNYGTVVMQRPREILDLLEQGCSVLYSDIDNVWVKDPFLDIGAAGPGNLYLTEDGKAKWFSTNYCTCFLYCHPHTATKQLMEAWSRAEGNRNQPPFNKELAGMPADSGLKKVVLPVAKFPPGNVAKNYPDATVFHANYLVGERRKVEFFEQRNMWNGEPSSTFPQPQSVQNPARNFICRSVGLLCWEV